MTKSVERVGKSVEEAVKSACEEFEIRKEDLKYDIISYGASGIFGLVGVKKAKIRVYLNDRKKSRKGPTPPKTKSRPPEKETPPEKGQEEENEGPTEETVIEPAAQEENTPAPEAVNPSPDVEREEPPLVLDDEVARPGRELLERITEYIAEKQTIETRIEKDQLHYEIKGDNAGILIGKKGQTLDAIQYLVEKIVNKKSDQRVRVMVDIEGYMENRINRLEGMAIKMAEKAKKIGKPVTIGQMNSQERKIIHLILKNDQNVRTQSMGDGYLRKIVVFPKGYSRKRRKGGRDSGRKD